MQLKGGCWRAGTGVSLASNSTQQPELSITVKSGKCKEKRARGVGIVQGLDITINSIQQNTLYMAQAPNSTVAMPLLNLRLRVRDEKSAKGEKCKV